MILVVDDDKNIRLSLKLILERNEYEVALAEGPKEAMQIVRNTPAIAKNLFTPFFSTKPQGQGLGLLLIRDILTSHHCTFNLLTDPEDHLTRFTIQFPIQKTHK